MLVKNTIIALMAVAPAFTIPVPGPVSKSTTTVATTKSTTPTTAKVAKAPVTNAKVAKAPATNAKVAKAPATKVSKAAVTKAQNNVKSDLANEAKLRKELKGLDSKLAVDRTAAKQLKQQEKLQKNGNTKTTHKAKLTGSTGKHTTKLTTKISQLSNHHITGKTSKLSTGHNQLSNHHTTGKTSKLSTGHNQLSNHHLKNKNNLRISTAGVRGTRHSVTPPGSALGTPRSGRSSLRSAVGTGQSAFSGGFPTGFSTGFQSPGFNSPFPNGMSEEVTFKPNTGGGYTERISFQPQSQQLSRRAVTPTTPPAPLSPVGAHIPRHKSRKSATTHQHTVAEAMQLSALLVEAEKVVNGLEVQMNKPQTVFANLKRKSKFKRPTTPVTPATPVTPSPVKTT
jgi:hypothetical protein